MIGLLTIGSIVLLALRKKRGVSGVGALSRFEWNIYRDLIDQIEDEIMNFIESNDFDRYLDDDVAPLMNPRLDISISPDSRAGYDFEVMIDEARYFQYPEKTYNIEPLITEHEDGYLTINYEELERVVMDFLDRQLGRDVAGIGRVKHKRRIYREMEIAQQSNVDFLAPYEEQEKRAKSAIHELTKRHNDSSKRVPITDEKYFNQLRKAYNAISGIGQTKLPYRESRINNHRGDTILIYRDYGTDSEIQQFANEYVQENYAQMTEQKIGYYETLVYLANGGKFIWDSTGEHRGVEKLLFGKKAPGEKKARRSYLATKSKGGVYPETFAESLMGYYGDDHEILSGVLECLREVDSRNQARKMIMDIYERDHTLSDYEIETPF